MKVFSQYLGHLDLLTSRMVSNSSNANLSKSIDEALDGQPAKTLRKLIPISDLRDSGAFFTGSKLSQHALRFLLKTIDDKSVILDPACGAGDLLIACVSQLPQNETVNKTLDHWSSRIIGRDLHPEFIQVTKSRLILSALRLSKETDSIKLSKKDDLFPNILSGCSLTSHDAFATATHIVINPPFSLVDAPKNCQWSSGKVNSAAIFMESCLLNAKKNTRIVAILPDVLRSGARYKKWRSMIEAQSYIRRVELYGKFDSWADVDVFILELEIKENTKNKNNVWQHSLKSSTKSIKDDFNICVGPVVDYRAPKLGPWHPFITAQTLTPWATISHIPRKRRFKGKVVAPPFIAVRRTSRPGDKNRAVGTIITGDKPVAVENHLLVLIPKDGSIKSCKKLIINLQRKETSNWLNQRIRCRHLTVGAVKEIPWREE